MINQIKKIFGFTKCMRCGHRRLRTYRSLFRPEVIYCFYCQDSKFEYGIWKYEKDSKEVIKEIKYILYTHVVPLSDDEMELVAKEILKLFDYTI